MDAGHSISQYLEGLEKDVDGLIASKRDAGPKKPHEECDLCGEAKPAATFCSTCSKYICDTCSEKHRKMKITKAHRILPFPDWVMCSTKHNLVAQFYCKEDKVLVCIKCVNDSHPECDIEDMTDEEFVKNIRMQFDARLDGISVQVPSEPELEESQVKLSEDLYARYGEGESHLEKLRLKFDQAIKSAQEKMKESLKNQMSKLKEYKEDNSRYKETIQKLLSHMNNVKERGDLTEMISLCEDLPHVSTEQLTSPSLETPKCLNGPDVEPLIDGYFCMVQKDHASSSEVCAEEIIVAANPSANLQQSAPILKPAGTYLVSPTADQNADASEPSSSAGKVKVEGLWEAKIGVDVDDLVYDPKTRAIGAEEDSPSGIWWVRTWDDDTKLWRYSHIGSLEGKLGGGALVNNNCRMIASHGDEDWTLVTTDKTGIVWLDSSGARMDSVDIPGAGALHGVAYSPQSGVYAVTDCGKLCLWFLRRTDAGQQGEEDWKAWGAQSLNIDADLSQSGDGKKNFDIRRVSGGGDWRLKWPSFITHHHHDNQCNFIVSDNGDHSLKIFSTSGTLVKRLCCGRQLKNNLSYPCGVCVDKYGRILVCDSGNKRVVRMAWNGENAEVLIGADDLNQGEPYCIDLDSEQRLLVGVDGGSLIKCFKLTN